MSQKNNNRAFWSSFSFHGICPTYISSLRFSINIALHIHQLSILSPLLHDIYYQQYYEDLKRECVTVVLNNEVLILMLECTFVLAGVEAAPPIPSHLVGITFRLFVEIYCYYYYYYYYYYLPLLSQAFSSWYFS